MEVVSKRETITRKKQVEHNTSAPTKGKSKKKSEENQEEKEKETKEKDQEQVTQDIPYKENARQED